jgi:hypothetical protein
MFVFERAPRLHPAGDGKATLSTQRTEAHRDAGHLRIHARQGAWQARFGTDPLQMMEIDTFARDWFYGFEPPPASEQERQRPLYYLRFAAM